MLASGTTVMLRQLQEKYITDMNHKLLPLVDLRKLWTKLFGILFGELKEKWKIFVILMTHLRI